MYTLSSPLIYSKNISNIYEFDPCYFTLNRSILFLKSNNKKNILQPDYVSHMFLISKYKKYLNMNIIDYALTIALILKLIIGLNNN